MNNLGLNQTQPGAKRVRRDPVRAPVREGDLWSTVTVVCEHGTSPALTCNNCGHAFYGGATHIAAHIREKCTAVSDAFLKLKQKEMEKVKEAEKQAKKAKQAVEQAVDAAAETPPAEQKPIVKVKGGKATMRQMGARTRSLARRARVREVRRVRATVVGGAGRGPGLWNSGRLRTRYRVCHVIVCLRLRVNANMSPF